MSTSSSVAPSAEIPQSVLYAFQNAQRTDEAIFLGLQVTGGQILLPILFLTVIVSRNVKRHAIFLSFLASWIFSSIAFSLLLYRGRSSDDDLSLDPSYDECLIQASLINGVQAWTICTTFTVVLHFWMTLRDIVKGQDDRTDRRGWGLVYLCTTIGGPLAVLAVFTIVSMLMGGRPIDSDGTVYPDTNLSVPSVFYCIIIVNANLTVSLAPGMKLFDAVYWFQLAISILTLFFEGDVIRMLYRQRKKVLSSRISKTDLFFIFLRIALFSAFRTLSIGLDLALIQNPDEILYLGLASNTIFNGVINFIQASMPLAAFFAFASEKDVIKARCSWGKRLMKRKSSDVELKASCAVGQA